MYLLYSLLLTLGLIVLLPRFAVDALRRGKYVTGLRQRLGKLPRIDNKGKPIIWLHCVSVGETQAAQSLVRALLEEFPSHSLAISTTTVTGQKLAQKLFAIDAAAVFYFPIDWAWTVRRTLSALKPSAVLIMETELWPRLLHECRARAIPVTLLNGRISDASFRRYQRIGTFIRRVLNDLTIALMQSEQDADRVRRLGLASERIAVLGNLKFDSANTAIDDRVTDAIRARFGIDGTRPLIVAASTHAPEERISLEAFRQVKTSQSNCRARLMIAPRHPERFAEVVSLLEASGLNWARRSAQAAAEDEACEVILLDTVGELSSVYPLADLVFVGGSIAPQGGHNVLEPAASGACVITGPHTQNFAAIASEFLNNRALIQLPDVPTDKAVVHLADVLSRLLADETKRREIGHRAVAVCRQNEGAAERTVQVLHGILTKPAPVDKTIPFSALHVTAAK